MRSVFGLVAASILMAGCAGQPAEEPSAAAGMQPYGNLAQMMRGIPFPNSNIIFDAQSIDPGAPPEATEAGGGATATFSSVYGGWQAVENAALALQETANLLKIPGRVCENGRPVPLENEDFQMFIVGLEEAGATALAAAQAQDWNEDVMFEVSSVMADACAACHEVYRDKEDNADRCIP